MNLDTVTADARDQALMASILLLAAQSDGSISPVESAELARLISDRFANSDEESIRLAAESTRRIPELSSTSELIEAANRGLPLPKKEDHRSRRTESARRVRIVGQTCGWAGYTGECNGSSLFPIFRG